MSVDRSTRISSPGQRQSRICLSRGLRNSAHRLDTKAIFRAAILIGLRRLHPQTLLAMAGSLMQARSGSARDPFRRRCGLPPLRRLVPRAGGNSNSCMMPCVSLIPFRALTSYWEVVLLVPLSGLARAVPRKHAQIGRGLLRFARCQRSSVNSYDVARIYI